jgi:hypothetical protein
VPLVGVYTLLSVAMRVRHGLCIFRRCCVLHIAHFPLAICFVLCSLHSASARRYWLPRWNGNVCNACADVAERAIFFLCTALRLVRALVSFMCVAAVSSARRTSRKAHFSADSTTRAKIMSAQLSTELRKKHGVR